MVNVTVDSKQLGAQPSTAAEMSHSRVNAKLPPVWDQRCSWGDHVMQQDLDTDNCPCCYRNCGRRGNTVRRGHIQLGYRNTWQVSLWWNVTKELFNINYCKSTLFFLSIVDGSVSFRRTGVMFFQVQGDAIWVATMSFSLLGLLRRGLAKIQYCTRL